MTASTKPIRAKLLRACSGIAFQCLLIAGAAFAIHGAFLDATLFFDDFGIFFADEALKSSYWDIAHALDVRWLPYASFEWTLVLLGDDIPWLRAGNVLLHIANGCVLMLFLRRLFLQLEPGAAGGAQSVSGLRSPLPAQWLAFFAALIFVLHPVTTFGVAYLVQRSILMATLFALLAWWLFLKGLLDNRRRWLILSALAYLLAGLSKQHAILVPAVSIALMLLVRKADHETLKLVWPGLLLYGLAGMFILYRVSAGSIFGQVYEPYARDILAALNIAPEDSYPLSVITQSYLFFNYLFLWAVPNPSWMSVTMGAGFARSYFSWPQMLGLFMFAAYLAGSLWLLTRKGARGVIGFAMIAPAIHFLVEFSAVRVQEIFVLYRSYLWMPCTVAIVPFLLRKMEARFALPLLIIVAIALGMASLSRMKIFSDTTLLWGESLRHSLASETKNWFAIGRIYHNRGLVYLNNGRYDEALDDFNAALRINPSSSGLYNDRAVAYLEKKMYREALADYDRAISMERWFPLYYYGRAKTYEAMGNGAEARRDYATSCRLGKREACAEMN